MTRRLLFLNSVLVFCAGPVESIAQKNSSPIVRIIAPQNESVVEGSTLSYRIKVSDKEDGESEYGEIAANEVFLEVRYLPEISKVSVTATVDPNGIASMKKSNCFTCHAFNGKLIAPSFYDIAKRYPHNSSSVELLAKQIKNGSGGRWGSASMPSHEEFTEQQTRDIANWILENGTDTNLNYYIGAEGIVKMKAPSGANKNGMLILSASYSDHGGVTGKDVITVHMK